MVEKEPWDGTRAQLVKCLSRNHETWVHKQQQQSKVWGCALKILKGKQWNPGTHWPAGLLGKFRASERLCLKKRWTDAQGYPPTSTCMYTQSTHIHTHKHILPCAHRGKKGRKNNLLFELCHLHLQIRDGSCCVDYSLSFVPCSLPKSPSEHSCLHFRHSCKRTASPSHGSIADGLLCVPVVETRISWEQEWILRIQRNDSTRSQVYWSPEGYSLGMTPTKLTPLPSASWLGLCRVPADLREGWGCVENILSPPPISPKGCCWLAPFLSCYGACLYKPFSFHLLVTTQKSWA